MRDATSQHVRTDSGSRSPASSVQNLAPKCPRLPTTVPILEQDGPLQTPCMVWQGYVGNHGYPVRTRRRGIPTVNREAYELERGSIPTGYVLHHWCENKLCLNVAHMEAVTRGDHVRIHRKGKPAVGGWQARKEAR